MKGGENVTNNIYILSINNAHIIEKEGETMNSFISWIGGKKALRKLRNMATGRRKKGVNNVTPFFTKGIAFLI